MYRYNLLRKNNGFLLLAAYATVIVLVIFGAALFSQVIHEHKFATRSQDDLTAKYAAERGIDYVLTEIKYNRYLQTHDAIPEGINFHLENHNPAPITADLKLNNVMIDGEGNYTSNFSDEKSRFSVKIYKDPLNPDETIILSRGVSGTEACLIVGKYVPSSLYQFFVFTPYPFWPYWDNYDAGGGKIHTNDWVIFQGGANFSNLSELSTSKYFRQSVYNMMPPGNTDIYKDDGVTLYTWEEVLYGMRSPSIKGNPTNDPLLKYYYNKDGLNFADLEGLLMLDVSNNAVAWDGTSPYLEPYEPINFNYYMCKDNKSDCANGYNLRHVTINGIQIPSRFASAAYDWNKYWSLTPPGIKYKDKYFTRPVEYITAHHFDSEKQVSEWGDFLKTKQNQNGETLKGILKDANTGGTHYEPLTISNADYRGKAQQGGIYIDYNSSGGILNVYHNNQPLEWTGDSIVINNKEVFKKKTFVDTSSTLTKNIIELNMGELKQAFPADPNAGMTENIIYSDYPIVVTNASEIPDKGLTTVCENNIYLHGNYNDVSDKPSSAISAKFIYTLSSDWNYPQTLASTIHNSNYPHVEDFYCPQGDTTCINNLLITDSKRKVENATHPDYPTGFNWELDNASNMPNTVDNAIPHIYRAAVVGYLGWEPQSLERWQYYTDPGTLTTPPTGKVTASRDIYGARIRLQAGDFPPAPGGYDWMKTRCCASGYNPCRDCTQYPGNAPVDMTVTYAYTSYFYNQQFGEGNVPPGDLVGYSSAVFLELADTPENWDYHYKAISMPPI